MKRRDFLTLVGGASIGWPLIAQAQQPARPVIGVLGTDSPDAWTGRVRIFLKGLSEAGFVEDRNVATEYRWAGSAGDANNRLSALAVDLVRQPVSVIVGFAGPRPALAAKAASATIPIVFITSTDPVQTGLVASLNHPGGNLTGVTTLNTEVAPKRLELLHELVPQATLIGALMHPRGSATAIQLGDLSEAAQKLGLQLQVVKASTEREIDEAFATLSGSGAGGLVIGVDSFLIARTEQIAELALRHKLPAIFLYREFAVAGGLMSYGGLTEGYRLAGVYTGRILKGAKPSDLPVEQATKVELIINLKSARALGLTVPATLLARADEVIE